MYFFSGVGISINIGSCMRVAASIRQIKPRVSPFVYFITSGFAFASLVYFIKVFISHLGLTWHPQSLMSCWLIFRDFSGVRLLQGALIAPDCSTARLQNNVFTAEELYISIFRFAEKRKPSRDRDTRFSSPVNLWSIRCVRLLLDDKFS